MPETSGGLDALANATWDFAVASLIIAGLAAALVQAAYNVGLRYVIQRILLRWWLSDRLRILDQPPNLEDVERDLVTVAGGGGRGSLYSLPYQQLCGQIGAAVQVEIDYPGRRKLIDAFATTALEDLKKVRTEASERSVGATDSDPSEELTDARQRLSFHVERSVDELQVYLGNRWTWSDQALALMVAVALTALLAFTPNRLVPGPDPSLKILFSVGIAAGFLAPTARYLLERVLYSR